jgi:hypothetical protein
MDDSEEEDDEHPNTPPITIEMEMEWLNQQDLSKYQGEWIAIFGLEIIAHGKTLAEVVKQVRAQLPSDMLPRYLMIPEGFITMPSAACLDCFFDRPNEADCAACMKKGKT